MTPSPQHAAPPRPHTRVTRVFVAVSATLSLLVAMGGIYSFATYQQVSSKGTTGGFYGDPKASGKPPPTGPCIDDVCNYLLLGSDSRAGLSASQQRQFGTNSQAGAGYNSDVIMVVHTDPKLQKAIILSFPRDLWVNIPGQGEGKINSSFGLGGGINGPNGGGPLLVARTIKALTGLTMNHYLYVDLAGFEGVVNTLGGVDMCISAENVNTPGYVTGTDASGGTTSTYYAEAGHIVDPNTGLDVVPGCQRLNATQALAWVRTRHLKCDAAAPDFFRIGRQQQFLRAVLNRLLQPTELAQAPRLVGPILSSMHRDDKLKVADLAYLVGQLRGISTGAAEFRSVPAYPFVTSGGLDALRMDPSAKQIFAAIRAGKPIGDVGITQKYTPPSPANIKVPVVDHGSGGKAAQVEKVLADSGFDISPAIQLAAAYGASAPGNVIAYAPGQSVDAEVVHQYLPGLRMKEVEGLPDPVAVFVTASYQPAQVGSGGTSTAPPGCVSPTG